MNKRIAKLLNCYIAKTENNNLTMKQYNNRPGFTLIELLIVIAVLGILVTGILVVLNPVEQTRRASDAQRASAINQLATGITAYSTSQLLQNYTPLVNSTWQDVLVAAGEIKTPIKIPNPKDSPSCSTNDLSSPNNRNVCLNTETSDTIVIIWANLDSVAEKTRAGCTSGQFPIVAYSSSQQKTGIGCVSSANAIPASTIVLK